MLPTPPSTARGSSSNSSRHGAAAKRSVQDAAPFDVLCGKVKSYCHHPGNRLFQKQIDVHVDMYNETTLRKGEKMRVTKEIVCTLRTKYNSRFVRLNQVGEWEELSQVEARDKVSHALRFAFRRANRESKPPTEWKASTQKSSHQPKKAQSNGSRPPAPSVGTQSIMKEKRDASPVLSCTSGKEERCVPLTGTLMPDRKIAGSLDQGVSSSSLVSLGSCDQVQAPAADLGPWPYGRPHLVLLPCLDQVPQQPPVAFNGSSIILQPQPVWPPQSSLLDVDLEPFDLGHGSGSAAETSSLIELLREEGLDTLFQSGGARNPPAASGSELLTDTGAMPCPQERDAPVEVEDQPKELIGPKPIRAGSSCSMSLLGYD